MAASGSQLTVFSWLFEQFDTVLNSYISQTASDLVSAISPTAWILLGVYFVLWGISMLRGLIEEPVTDGLMRLLKLAIVLGLALNVGLYQTHVVEFFMKTPDAMAGVLAYGDSAAGVNQSTYGMIDTLLNKAIDTARAAWDKISITSPGQAFALGLAGLLIALVGGFFTLAAGVMILLAKISMVLLLALGPVFIMMLMFRTTQRFFEAWLSQVINYMILLVLLLAAVTLFFSLAGEAIDNASAMVDRSVLEALLTVFVACGACSWLLFKVEPMASALASGVALAMGDAAKRALGGGLASAVSHDVKRRMAGRLVSAALAKPTGGASVVAGAAANAATRSVGTMHRASNAIRPG